MDKQPKAPKARCKLWWCDKPVNTAGLCQAHYMRYWRTNRTISSVSEMEVVLTAIGEARVLLKELLPLINPIDLPCPICGKVVLDSHAEGMDFSMLTEGQVVTLAHRHTKECVMNKVSEWLTKTAIPEGSPPDVMATYVQTKEVINDK